MVIRLKIEDNQKGEEGGGGKREKRGEMVKVIMMAKKCRPGHKNKSGAMKNKLKLNYERKDSMEKGYNSRGTIIVPQKK